MEEITCANQSIHSVRILTNNISSIFASSSSSSEGVDAIFVNTILTGIQQRNLERAWGKPVLDRLGLIIEIFNAHAQTKKAKLQYAVFTCRRGSGGRGFISGAGETELQLQRRRRKVLLSDTVGFIKELPIQVSGQGQHQLVEVFHATLEEVVEADLLHVLDSSAPNINEQREAVLPVLGQIGVSEQKLHNMIKVWNKDLPDCDTNENEDFEQGELGQVINDQQGNYSDEWLVSGDEQDSWVDYNGSSVGCGSAEVQQNDRSKKWEFVRSETQSGSESAPHVKTSALTGVGLQELLELLDEKLKPQKTIEKDIFDRKWISPHAEDSKIAVEQ
ncbi:hypothetical protein RND71_033034 [Anisodus tanguticus]|uniref:GTPase HflX N-terminal domain-containing protein n=1 Tax=Anisodus tanguticus TaxID=243964 RepID=A0AAE1R7S7_9SOLA|nr:hypothetical protein RND71_033034 [Anisodus tanguticus]